MENYTFALMRTWSSVPFQNLTNLDQTENKLTQSDLEWPKFTQTL